ncbi:MAG: hypothetical protein PVG83_08520 [Acidimicrobiia bacterium]|jgi:hypothetical protein
MAQIDIKPLSDVTYQVKVTEGDSSSTHEVALLQQDLDRLGSGASAEELIEASLRFLLDREPKESILDRFDLTVIGRYFPDYPDRIGGYL